MTGKFVVVRVPVFVFDLPWYPSVMVELYPRKIIGEPTVPFVSVGIDDRV
jgi:hypothetical protein